MWKNKEINVSGDYNKLCSNTPAGLYSLDKKYCGYCDT